jgi:hypothetical protein
MATIRIDDTIKPRLGRYGKSMNDSVKALLDIAEAKPEKFDYNFIRDTINDCFTKHMIK